MKRKIILRSEARHAIGKLGLAREALLDLLLCIYRDVPRDYSWHCQFRAENPLNYEHRLYVTLKTGQDYLLSIEVDDSTLPDHLVIINVECKLF